MTTSSLGRRIGNDHFAHVVARYLREAAQQSRASFGSSPFLDNHAHALGELADLIASADLEDQHVRALWLIQGYTGGPSDGNSPGENAQQVVASCGLGPEVPTAAESLAELVAASVEDLGTVRREGRQAADKADKEIAALEESNRTVSEELREAKEREERLRSELAGAKEREANLQAQANHLRRALDTAVEMRPRPEAKKAKKKPKQPRRVRVEGEEYEGVYHVTKTNGAGGFTTVLEVGWKDATGKQRWKRLDHMNLDEAKELRDKLHHKEPAPA